MIIVQSQTNLKYLLCRLDFNEFYLGREQLQPPSIDFGGDDGNDDDNMDHDYDDEDDDSDYGQQVNQLPPV